MNANGQQFDPPDLSRFDEKRSKFPVEQLLPYTGLHIAWDPETMRILASANSAEEVDEYLAAQGIHFSQVVHDYIDDL